MKVRIKFEAAKSPAVGAAGREEAARKAVGLFDNLGEKEPRAKFSSGSDSWIERKIRSLSKLNLGWFLGALTRWQRWEE